MAAARGITRAVRDFSFKRNLRKSQLAWMPNQKRGDWLKNFPSRIDISAVMDRRPSTISLTVRGETPSPRASAFCDKPSGLRYSSRRISPGVIGFMGFRDQRGTSNAERPTPHRTGEGNANIEHPTPNGRKCEHRTSNAELPTSNRRKSKSERKRLPSANFTSSVRRSALIERKPRDTRTSNIQRRTSNAEPNGRKTRTSNIERRTFNAERKKIKE